MAVKQLTDNVSVASQLSLADVAIVAREGFKSIVCNRPDGESPDQPSFDEIRAAAAEMGLEAHYHPVVTGKITERDVDTFADLLRDLPKPILAYCRSGTRCTTLWALAEAGNCATEEILECAAQAGYDLYPLRASLEARAMYQSG